MIYMTADQAADFFGADEIPATVVISTPAELNARVVAALAAAA